MLAKSIVILCILVTLAENIHGKFSNKAHAEDFYIVSRICAPPNNNALCAAQCSRCYIRQNFNITRAFCSLKDSVAGVLDYYNSWIQDICNISDPCIASSHNQFLPGMRQQDHMGEMHPDHPGPGHPGPGHPGPGHPDHPGPGFPDHLGPDHDNVTLRLSYGQSNACFGNGIGISIHGVNISSFLDYLKSQSADVFDKFECAIGQYAGLFDSSGMAIETAWLNLISNKSDGLAQAALNSTINQCVTSEGTTCKIESFTYCAVYPCYLNLTATAG